MQFSLSWAILPLAARAANIILSNDDGWAEINVRAFYETLTAAGESVVLSSPAENQSGTGKLSVKWHTVYNHAKSNATKLADFLFSGSLTGTPSVLSEPCEFDSCPTGSPAIGFNASNPRLNYVNSYPATAMSYGIRTLAPQFFGGAPDFAVSGPNTVGRNKALSLTPSQQLTRFREPRDRCPFCRDHRCGGRGNE